MQSTDIKSILASFEARVVQLERDLDVAILLGSPYLLIAKFEGHQFEFVYGSWERPGKYSAAGPDCFASLDLAGDSLCGCIQFSPEDGERAVVKVRDGGVVEGLRVVSVELRHCRDEQRRRLVMCRDMVALLRGRLAGLEAMGA